jgi:WD40 repeat protein/serine/threonine protein kinase
MMDPGSNPESEDRAFSDFVTAFQEALVAGAPPPSPEHLSPSGRARWEKLRPALLLLARAGGDAGARPMRPFLETPTATGSPGAGGDTQIEVREAPRQLGRFQVIRELGRGGMGIVYLARDPELQRLVAIKTIMRAGMADPDQLARFEAEARLHAQQHHPNIVQVHETGRADGQPFLVMEYVDGASLSQHLEGRPMEAHRAAALLAEVARAIEHAHKAGIIHRDLKPSNILLAPVASAQWPVVSLRDAAALNSGALATGHWQPKVTDFGLAKSLGSSFDLTRSGDLVGTPSYMAPEVVGGSNPRDIAVDIYGLGAILYEALTGHAPFVGSEVFFILSQVQTADPVSPRSLNPQVPADLETICLKCLRKEPWKRYARADDLADDLQRFLAGQPVLARPVSLSERAIKWARRRPAISALMAVILVLVPLSFVLVTSQWLRANREWNRAEENARDEARARRDAEDLAQREQRARKEAELLSVSAQLDQSIMVAERADVGRGLLGLARGLEMAERIGDTGLQRVARMNLASWRGHLIRDHAQFSHKEWVWAVAFSPDGRTALTGGRDKTARRWDVATGQLIGKPLAHDFFVWAVAYSPDGRTILTGSGEPRGEARLWDAATGEPLGPPLPHPAPVRDAAFSPDASLFLTVAPDAARVWRTATARPLGPPLQHTAAQPGTILAAAFSPDNKRVLTGGSDGTARLWDAATSEAQQTLQGHRAPVAAVGFCPDGKLLATSSYDGNAQLWETASGKPWGGLLMHGGPIRTLTFSPDAQLLATGGITVEVDPATQQRRITGGSVQMWSTATGRRVGEPLLHPAPVWSLAFHPNTRILLSGCEDGFSRFWQSGALLGKPPFRFGTVRAVAFSPDGTHALTADAASPASLAHLWEVPRPATHGNPWYYPSAVTALAFSPDGRYLLAGTDGGLAEFREAATGRTSGQPLKRDDKIVALGFSKDGSKFALATSNAGVVIWDRTTDRSLREIPVTNPYLSCALSPDGQTLLTGEVYGAVLAWDLRPRASGGFADPVGVGLGHGGPTTCLAISADGRVALSTSSNRATHVCTTAGWRLLYSLPHSSGVLTGAVSPDGRTLLTGTLEGTAQLWNADTGRPLGPPLLHQGEVRAAAFSPDGRLALTAGTDRMARLWDTATGKLVMPPLWHRDEVLAVAFHPDGRLLATACKDRTVQLWDVPVPLTGSAERIRLELEVATGMTVDERNTVHLLSPADEKQLRQRLEQMTSSAPAN